MIVARRVSKISLSYHREREVYKAIMAKSRVMKLYMTARNREIIVAENHVLCSALEEIVLL